MAKNDILQLMGQGFPPLSESLAGFTISDEENNRLDKFVEGIRKYREYAQLTENIFTPQHSLDTIFQERGDNKVKIRGSVNKDTLTYPLTDKEVDEFKQNGILGPFDLMTPDEAAQLAERSIKAVDNEFDDHFVLGDKVKEVLKETDTWRINYAGVWQALYQKHLWDILASPKITDRLACLLGEDIICWRSQFFELKPGQTGTFWHQASSFRESSQKPKLQPPDYIPDPSVQYTVWIALTDVDTTNGCLRQLAGSFEDSRCEKFYNRFRDEIIPYLATQPDENIKDILRIFFYSPGMFFWVQKLFEIMVDNIPDLFDGYTHRNLEMKAGQFVIFTSSNMHGSHPNTSDYSRIAFAGRYTSNDVKVYDGFNHDFFPTAKGNIEFPLDNIGCMQVKGKDHFGHNKIMPYRW